MSRFSGKCDVYDHFAMGCDGDDNKLQQEIERTDFYIPTSDGRLHRLKIENEKDLAPYYPYLTVFAVYGREGRQCIHLSSKSFIEREEQERLNWNLKDTLREYNKCKRKKIPFIPEEYIKNSWYGMSYYQEEIVYRVAKDGNKATTEELHTPIHDYYRKELAEELERLGYNDWFIRQWLFEDRDNDFNWRDKE